jgi:hypothetical protein
MKEEYRYTQVGTTTIIMILLVAVFTAFMIIPALESSSGAVIVGVGLLVVGLFVLTLASFYSFTIQIVGGSLTFWFGFGVSRKTIDIKQIQSIEIVKTPWYYFWGIKSIPGGWLYSIAPGGQALELILKDSSKIHLGTDRPGEIKERIESVMGVTA